MHTILYMWSHSCTCTRTGKLVLGPRSV